MTIGFDKALGIHEQALQFRSQRTEVLAQNLANADTPNYKARDLDFRTALQQAAERQSGHVTDAAGMPRITAGATSFYRVPTQPSIDGNTVETDVEQAQFARNAEEFQASFTLLNGRFRNLMTAIRGD